MSNFENTSPMHNDTMLSARIIPDNTMKTMKKKSPKYLNELSTEQLMAIAEVMPKWVFENRPYFMLYYKPEWVSKYEPSWMADNDTKYMIDNHMQWMIYNRPSTVVKLNLSIVIEKNPNWCVKNIPELLAYKAPELLKEYDQAVLKEFCPEEHIVITSFWKRVKNFFGRYWHYGTNKAQILHDPILPREVLDAMK